MKTVINTTERRENSMESQRTAGILPEKIISWRLEVDTYRRIPNIRNVLGAREAVVKDIVHDS